MIIFKNSRRYNLKIYIFLLIMTKFRDNIYNIIEVDNIAKSIIDTFEFQN